jgi:hypothetical protein
MNDYINCMAILTRGVRNPMDDAIKGVQRSICGSRLDITMDRIHLAGRLAGEEFENLGDDDKQIILTDADPMLDEEENLDRCERAREIWDKIDVTMWKIAIANLTILVTMRMLREPEYGDLTAINMPIYKTRLNAYKNRLNKLKK